MIRPAPLPYAYNALEPYMSEATLRFHHDGHYLRYVQKVNQLTKGAFDRPSEAYAHAVAEGDVHLRQQAAQAAAHEAFFGGMSAPAHRALPSPGLVEALSRAFGDRFEDHWVETAQSIFGSGWLYLVAPAEGVVELVALQGGVLPTTPVVLVMDVWEHAYYLDYPDDRPTYSRNWLRHLVDWQAASIRFDHPVP